MLESPDMHPNAGCENEIFLASNSPRRHALLRLLELEYKHLPAQVDETPQPGEDGAAYVRRIAERKAALAAADSGVHGVILAADTAVIDRLIDGKDEILGKPSTEQQAVDILRRLRGHSHQVLTGLALLRTEDGTMASDLCSTNVPMREYSDEEILVYVSSGDPMDKAGAYAIQHVGFHPVDSMNGCFANVMGLPLCHLTRSLRKLGIKPDVDVPVSCQAALEYVCPVYRDILSEED